MLKPLPPLQALRALEAASRHRSFTRAADELNLTHSAISHHLRGLEDTLGTPLFRRVGARMIPTRTGARLAERVRVSLAEIAEALDEARAGERGGIVRLEVSAMSDLAGNWLIRRLNGFSAQHPQIELMLRVHSQLAPPDPYTADLGIWHKPISEPGFVSHKLLDDQLIAVVSPALLAQMPHFTVADIRKLPMLRFAHRSWRDWLEAAGLPLQEPTFGPIFDNPDSLLQAAIAGQGAVTSRSLLVRDAIEQGVLVQIGNVYARAALDYYVSWREHHPREAEILAFYEWLRAQLVV
jgi:LysR family transcriptional regulator, glycine cleavage system transcriptional activator